MGTVMNSSRSSKNHCYSSECRFFSSRFLLPNGTTGTRSHRIEIRILVRGVIASIDVYAQPLELTSTANYAPLALSRFLRLRTTTSLLDSRRLKSSKYWLFETRGQYPKVVLTRAMIRFLVLPSRFNNSFLGNFEVF